jgi:hypothetical protein
LLLCWEHGHAKISSFDFSVPAVVPAQAPVETVSMVYVVIFGILFVGMIAGFFIYLWMSDKGEASKEK